MLRKDFLQSTSLLLGGTLLTNFSSLYASKLSGKIKLGIIGCGDRGLGVGLMAQKMSEKFMVTAVCDILDFRLENAKKEFKQADIFYTKFYAELLSQKNVDAVIIATPLYNHFTIAKDSLSAGKHVYLEKTMTYSIEQAKELVKIAEKHKNLTLQVGHQYRYTPLYFRVKEMIEKDYVGQVTQIDCRWDRNWDWRRMVPAGYTDKQVNWRLYKEFSGGLVAELLSHQMDFINWAFDTHPTEIMGMGGIDTFNDGREVFDNVQTTFRYGKNNMIGNFGATSNNGREGYIFKIKGSKGTVALLPYDGIFYPEEKTKKELTTVDGVTGATKIEWRTDGGIPIMPEKQKDGTWFALEDFYKSISEKTLPSSNVKTGATTAICVSLSNEAIYNHKLLTWNDDYNV